VRGVECSLMADGTPAVSAVGGSARCCRVYCSAADRPQPKKLEEPRSWLRKSWHLIAAGLDERPLSRLRDQADELYREDAISGRSSGGRVKRLRRPVHHPAIFPMIANEVMQRVHVLTPTITKNVDAASAASPVGTVSSSS
jgi:hypothetical protein